MAQSSASARIAGRRRGLLQALLMVAATAVAIPALVLLGRTQQVSTTESTVLPVHGLPNMFRLEGGRIRAVIQDGWDVEVLHNVDLKGTAGDTTRFDLRELTDAALKGTRLGASSSLWSDRTPAGTSRREPSRPVRNRQDPSVKPPVQAPEQSNSAQSIAAPPMAVLPDGENVAWTQDQILFWTARKVLSGVLLPDQAASLGAEFAKLDGVPVALAVTDSGRLVIAYSDSHFEIRDAVPGRVIASQRTVGVARSIRQEGSLLAVLSDAAVLVVAPDSSAATPLRRLEWKPRALSAAISPRGRVAVGTADGSLILFPAPKEAGGAGRTLSAPGPIRALSFLTEDRLVIGGDFRGLDLIDDRGALTPILGEPVGVRAIAVEGSRIAYATEEEIRSLEIRFGLRVSGRGLLIIGAWLLLIAGIRGTWILARRRSVGLDESSQQARAAREEAHPAPLFPRPDPPGDLIRACREGECVLYAGAGLSAQAGLPTWSVFIRGLIGWSKDHGFVKAETAESLVASVTEGQADAAADAVLGALDEKGKESLRGYLTNLFSWRNPGLMPVHRILREIPFAAALTTNFDDLLEHVWPISDADILTPREPDRLRELLARRSFFILKLYGSLQRPDTLLVAPAEFAYATRRNVQFAEAIQGLLASRTILFLGSSLEGIEAYLSPLALGPISSRTHYALVDVQGTAWQARADVLRRRYGIIVLPYTATAGFPELPEFLKALATSVKPVKGEEPVVRDGSRTAESFVGLKRVRLVNIGPFENLSLDLNSSWNVLLGDNGVGKSTILKAIAAGLCGRDAEPYATRLIRTGEPSGTIVLETTSSTYQIEIRRRDAGAEVSVSPAPPLNAEGWLAIGFPPLRTTTWGRSKGPTVEGRWSPNAQDLLPLLKGEPDPRMDQIKQWIVNLDARIHDTRGAPAASEAGRRLLDRFSATVDQVTPGLEVRFSRVDRETYQVWMRTDDGEVPIESISQGTTSLISWIGVLLARFFDVYPDVKDPAHGFALVLIDELDAHMHPEWQQSVVHDLQEIFPKAQFIVTTHSPLVVGGLPAEQVVRFRRGLGGRIERVEVSPEMTMGRADQVLTGELFGMRTTLDPETQRQVNEYQRLLGRSDRTAEEEQEFQRLRNVLRLRIPVSPETPPERKAFELVQAMLQEQIRPELAEARDDLARKARELLDAVERERGSSA